MASFHNTVFLLLLSLASAAVAVAAEKSTTTTHLHFYMHDTATPPTNATNVRAVVGPAGGSSVNFGDIYVIDDPLTAGPRMAADSQPVGRAQGFYTVVSLSPPQTAEFAFALTFNMVFTAGEYNGSTVAILGRDAAFTPVREVSVVGGSGAFRMARGYALIKTFSWDQTLGNAVLEWDVFVMH